MAGRCFLFLRAASSVCAELISKCAHPVRVCRVSVEIAVASWLFRDTDFCKLDRTPPFVQLAKLVRGISIANAVQYLW